MILTNGSLAIPAYVASVAPRDLGDARRLAAKVPERATAIEYRLDQAEARIDPRRLLEWDERPAILTYRTLREGGRFDGSADEYRRLVAEAYDAGAVVDVELASGLLSDASALPDRRRVIVSMHAPFGLPQDWRARIEAMRATGARVAKLVGGAADLASSLRIAALQREMAGEPAAIFPMGPASPPGRLVSAFFGSALVYGSVEDETAVGQIPIRDFLEIYDGARPRRIEAFYGIVAENPRRSLSPLLHNALFRARELPFVYLPLPVDDFERDRPDRLDFDPPFRGFSVTQPWKLAAARAGVASEDVALTGAANTLVRARGGWRAENTDVDGIFDPLADHDTGEGRMAIVLGAGGAARAAVVAARRLGYEVVISARREERAERVAEELRVDTMAWSDVASSEADLYVNATSSGWRDGEPSPIPSRVLENRPLVFDCVYRRDGEETATVRAAKAAGCPVVDGLKMFAAQAVRQAQLFGLREVTSAEVERFLREAVEK